MVQFFRKKINGPLTFEHLTYAEHNDVQYLFYKVTNYPNVVKSRLQDCSFDKELGKYTYFDPCLTYHYRFTHVGDIAEHYLMTWICLELVQSIDVQL